VPAASGFTSGSFSIPTLGETSTNVWYRIQLTVTDSAGLTRSVFRDVSPHLTQVTLRTQPPGLPVSLDGPAQVSPQTYGSVVGMTRSVSTPVHPTIGSTMYEFVSWSDGGAMTHDISATASPITLTATFRVLAIPAAPTLAAPAGTIFIGQPTYRWNAVTDGVDYQLWVENAASTPVLQPVMSASSVCSAGVCSTTPTLVLPAGMYTAWIQARNAAGGRWSAAVGFTVSGPPRTTLVAPSGSISTSRPTFSWSAVPEAVDYQLWVEHPSGTAVIQTWYSGATVCAGGTCSVTPTTALMDGAHMWWVLTRSGVGNGNWSSGMSFTVAGPPPPAAPTLVAPNGTVTTSRPTFTWNAVSGSTDYYLWVENATNTPVIQTISPAASLCSGATCSLQAPSALANGGYTWWVQARNGALVGGWSMAMTFTLSPALPPTVVLQGPTGTVNTATPTYTWSPSTGATGYYLWVEGPAGTPVVQIRYAASVCTTVCTVTPAVTLIEGAHRFWVQPTSANGDGMWSQPLAFTYARPPLGVPTPQSPTGAVTTRQPTYTWTTAVNASQYYLWVENPAGMPVVQIFYPTSVCTGSTCSVTPAITLAPGPHRFWVEARNGTQMGPWSPAHDFTVQ
jgi:hypothetical protein